MPQTEYSGFGLAAMLNTINLLPKKSMQPTRFAARLNSNVCAGHGTKRVGCKSRHQVYAEPKVSRRARASPRGGVWRKPKAKSRGDEQKPDPRRGASGASGHVTAKPSICDWGVLCKSGVYARTVSCLTPGGLSGASAD